MGMSINDLKVNINANQEKVNQLESKLRDFDKKISELPDQLKKDKKAYDDGIKSLNIVEAGRFKIDGWIPERLQDLKIKISTERQKQLADELNKQKHSLALQLGNLKESIKKDVEKSKQAESAALTPIQDKGGASNEKLKNDEAYKTWLKELQEKEDELKINERRFANKPEDSDDSDEDPDDADEDYKDSKKLESEHKTLMNQINVLQEKLSERKNILLHNLIEKKPVTAPAAKLPPAVKLDNQAAFIAAAAKLQQHFRGDDVNIADAEPQKPVVTPVVTKPISKEMENKWEYDVIKELSDKIRNSDLPIDRALAKKHLFNEYKEFLETIDKLENDVTKQDPDASDKFLKFSEVVNAFKSKLETVLENELAKAEAEKHNAEKQKEAEKLKEAKRIEDERRHKEEEHKRKLDDDVKKQAALAVLQKAQADAAAKAQADAAADVLAKAQAAAAKAKDDAVAKAQADAAAKAQADAAAAKAQAEAAAKALAVQQAAAAQAAQQAAAAQAAQLAAQQAAAARAAAAVKVTQNPFKRGGKL